jgi:CRISPR-associated protein Cmr5
MLREQQRALWAYKLVEGVSQQDRSVQEAFKITANRLGAHIMREGLASTMAFLLRDGRGGHTTAVNLLLEGLVNQDAKLPVLKVTPQTTSLEFMKQILGLDANGYMLVTRELLKMALWLKRANQALLSGVAEGDEGR